MRYTPTHKAQTKQRIVAAAARLFRRHGYDGVGIDAIMAAAGLTRGGFYGHFRSKAELYRAVLRGDHGLLVHLRERPGTDANALAREGLGVLRDYLAPENRTAVLRGCTLAALCADTARADRASRRAYADVIREITEELSRGLGQSESADARALSALAVAVGGLLLSSAASADPALADRVSRAASDLTAKLLG